MKSKKVGVGLSYLIILFDAIVSIFLTPFILRSIGQAEYGVYKLVISINAYLLLLDLGIGNATTRFIAKYHEEEDYINERKYLGVATIYYLIVAIITIIIGVILVFSFPSIYSKGLTGEEIRIGQKLLSITMMNTAVTLGTTGFSYVVIAYEHFLLSKGLQLIQTVIRVVLTVIVLKLNFGSVGIVTVNFVANILIRIFYCVYVLNIIKLRPIFREINMFFIKDIVVYSFFVLLQMIATQMNNSVDQIMIGMIVPYSASILGIYGIGSLLVSYFLSIGSSFKGLMMPSIVKLVSNEADKIRLSDEIVRIGRITYMITLMIWIGFAICGKQFISLWVGNENFEAYYVAIILMFAQMIIVTISASQYVFWALNQHKELAITKISIVVCNIVLTYFLIKWKPLIGATIGTFISLFIGDIVVMTILLKQKLNISIINVYLKIFGKISICGIVSSLFLYFVSSWFPESWGGLVGSLLSFMMIYFGFLYIWGMNTYEKNQVNVLLYIRR